MSTTADKTDIVALIADVFAERGAEAYLGERVTMSEHMLQTAQLAAEADAGDALIAAALLHDIGHFTGAFPDDALARGIDNHHAEAGAALLAPFLPEIVTDCVRQHVAAKRYLCATDPGYAARLSPASVHTLALQGGAMVTAEVTAFRAQPHLDAIVRVRTWDEGGKVPGKAVPPFDHYVPLLKRLVDEHGDRQSR